LIENDPQFVVEIEKENPSRPGKSNRVVFMFVDEDDAKKKLAEALKKGLKAKIRIK